MNAIEILKERYGYTNPIILKDVRIGGMSKAALRKELSRAVDKGILLREKNGIYSFKSDNPLDGCVTFEKIIEKKFVKNDYDIPGLDIDIYGYYTGLSFINLIGISQQVPAVIEVTTNKTSCTKVFKIGSRSAVIKKSRTAIDNRNYRVLQFFEMFESLTLREIETNKEVIINYAKKNILKPDFQKYLSICSVDTINKLLKTGLLTIYAG